MLGSGTIGDPYIIQDVNDLQAMQNDLSAYYELGNDIDASITSTWNGGAGFLPIGRLSPYFTGHFDGKDYIINDLYINRNGTDYVGLFGITESTAVIQNVHLVNVNIHGEDGVGALIGWMIGDETIINCSTSGSVTGRNSIGGLIGHANGDTKINIGDCYSYCTIICDDSWGGYNSAGGFIGYTRNVDIDRCYSLGNIVGLTKHVGGFVGEISVNTAINRSYATGNVSTGDDGTDSICGGFLGWSNGECINCYARGSVTGTGDYVGGFAGVAGTETNCYSTGAVNGVGANIGGFCGVDDTETACFWDIETSGQATDPSPGATGKTTAEMKDIQTFLDVGWNFGTIWGITTACNDGYPCLLSVTPYCSYSPRSDYFQEGTPLDISALEGIRNVEMSGMGRFYIDEEGKAKYESRYARNA